MKSLYGLSAPAFINKAHAKRHLLSGYRAVYQALFNKELDKSDYELYRLLVNSHERNEYWIEIWPPNGKTAIRLTIPEILYGDFGISQRPPE